MKLAFFDTKSYDIPGFDRYALPAGIEIKYYEPNLNRDTVSLALTRCASSSTTQWMPWWWTGSMRWA